MYNYRIDGDISMYCLYTLMIFPRSLLDYSHSKNILPYYTEKMDIYLYGNSGCNLVNFCL